jgi:hypothetical protein
MFQGASARPSSGRPRVQRLCGSALFPSKPAGLPRVNALNNVSSPSCDEGGQVKIPAGLLAGLGEGFDELVAVLVFLENIFCWSGSNCTILGTVEVVETCPSQ